MRKFSIVNFLLIFCFILPSQLVAAQNEQVVEKRSFRSFAVMQRLRVTRVINTVKKAFTGKTLLPQEKKDLQRVITYSGLGTGAIILLVGAGFLPYKKLLAYLQSLPTDESETEKVADNGVNTKTKRSPEDEQSDNTAQESASSKSKKKRPRLQDLFPQENGSSDTATNASTPSTQEPTKVKMTASVEKAAEELMKLNADEQPSYPLDGQLTQPTSSDVSAAQPSTQQSQSGIPTAPTNPLFQSTKQSDEQPGKRIVSPRPQGFDPNELQKKAAITSKQNEEKQISGKKTFRLPPKKAKEIKRTLVDDLAESAAAQNAAKVARDSVNQDRNSAWDEEKSKPSAPVVPKKPEDNTVSGNRSSNSTKENDQKSVASEDSKKKKKKRAVGFATEVKDNEKDSLNFKQLLSKRRASMKAPDEDNGTRHFTREEVEKLKKKYDE